MKWSNLLTLENIDIKCWGLKNNMIAVFRVGEGLELCLPNLNTLILTNNSLQVWSSVIKLLLYKVIPAFCAAGAGRPGAADQPRQAGVHLPPAQPRGYQAELQRVCHPHVPSPQVGFLNITQVTKSVKIVETHGLLWGKILGSRPVIGQAADTSQSQVCYWEFFPNLLKWSKCLNYFHTFGDLCNWSTKSSAHNLSRIRMISCKKVCQPSFKFQSLNYTSRLK